MLIMQTQLWWINYQLLTTSDNSHNAIIDFLPATGHKLDMPQLSTFNISMTNTPIIIIWKSWNIQALPGLTRAHIPINSMKNYHRMHRIDVQTIQLNCSTTFWTSFPVKVVSSSTWLTGLYHLAIMPSLLQTQFWTRSISYTEDGLWHQSTQSVIIDNVWHLNY